MYEYINHYNNQEIGNTTRDGNFFKKKYRSLQLFDLIEMRRITIKYSSSNKDTVRLTTQFNE